ncbi:hypothetical protein NX059_008891 [Plenodomus lindquistii]|nr:hypothetical protein NX059_008891 [Plenodomus lindquistii]
MSPPTLSRLCSVCRTVPIAKLFSTECTRERDAKDLGQLEDILRTSDECELCAAVVASFQAQQPWTKAGIEKTLKRMQDDNGGTNVWLYSYIVLKEVGDSAPILRVAVSTQLPDKGPEDNNFHRRTHAGDLQLMESSAKQLKMLAKGRGRVIAAVADLSLARAWVDECLQDHGNLCSLPSSDASGDESEGPVRLKAVDVKERRVVYLPSGAQYVALSYCWPREPGLTSLRSVDLSVEGAVSIPNGLSRTFDDACRVVDELGERYIWVDALCIVQDDPEDKVIQISQMNLIYGHALLTLVASPDDVDDISRGLPGYHETSGTRCQTVLTVQGVEVGVPKPCLEDLLSYTRWETRGWTFQESYLSRRLIYFTSQQLYFQCSCGIRCEDTAGEGLSPSTFVSHSSNLWNPRNKYAADPDSDDDYGDLILSHTGYDSDSMALRAYDNFVSYYLRRELSFGSDTLNAFKGIEQVLSNSIKTEFYAGLPIKWLDHALLWQLFGPGSKRVGFPSFSWAAWEGGAESPYWMTPSTTRRILSWYRSESGAWVRCDTVIADAFNGVVDPPDIQNHHVPMGGCSLITRTQTASFQLSLTPTATEEAHLRPDGEHLWVLDATSHKAGIILVDRAWKGQNVTANSRHDFVLLSQTQHCRIKDIASFDEMRYGRREWCLLNVMLVNWLDDGTAERVAVGTIHCDAWVAADVIVRTVCLV